MIAAILRKIFGTKHERDVKRMTPTVEAINALEPAIQTLGEAELQAKTDALRKRLEAGQKRPLNAGDIIQIGTVQLKLMI